MIRGALVAALLLVGLDAGAAPPQPARGVFVSRNYAFTFRAPESLTYCPLADDWTGSDHGTILFLVPPASCGGAGYPSSSRGFMPDKTPRIEIYYGIREPEVSARPHCAMIGRTRFLARDTPLCLTVEGATVIVAVSGRYVADSDTEAVLSLVTAPERLGRDLPVLRALAASAHPCTIPWQDARGRTRIMGSGHACRSEGDFY